jgi:MIT (microtubule interacting and transport) domain
MNSSVAGRSQRRKSSRTNSTSSSVVTVKKAASVSSRSGSRTPHSATRPRSPDELGPQLTALLQSSFDRSAKGRRSSSWSRPGSSSGIKEGVGNLNRWSQSTTSSASGQENALRRKRKSSTSKHMSIGLLPMPASEGLERPQNAEADEGRPSSRRSPGQKFHRIDAPVLATLDPNLRFNSIGDLRTPSSASNPFETASAGNVTPLTAELLTPSTAPTDYFGEQWSSRQRAPSNGPRPPPRTGKGTESPKVQRSFQRSPQIPIDLATKPMPALPSEASLSDAEVNVRVWKAGHTRSQGQDRTGSGDTETGSSMSSTGSERHPQQYQRSPVQKTMLSQALSRANSAVLFDNAQDFRGAIEAYEDACQLLRQVMLRSSGNEDRSKLQAIVSKTLPCDVSFDIDRLRSEPHTSIA